METSVECYLGELPVAHHKIAGIRKSVVKYPEVANGIEQNRRAVRRYVRTINHLNLRRGVREDVEQAAKRCHGDVQQGGVAVSRFSSPAARSSRAAIRILV